MTGNMNTTLVVLLLISVLSSSAALPMEKTLQLIQPSESYPSDSITTENSQDMRVSSFGARQKRGSSANTKKPAQYCAGCFSVIGDPTKPQQ